MTQLSREDLIKHWLLNTAIEFRRPLLHILPFVRGETLNAKEIPGCHPEDYAAGLREMFRSGHLVFTSDNSEDDVKTPTGVDVILRRFIQYPSELVPDRHVTKTPQPPRPSLKVPRVEFALTESGGALWESVAQPDWNKFLDSGIVIAEQDYESGDAVSPDITLLMAHLGWFTELNSEVGIDIESLEIQEHTDYPILYWKKLPHVYRATFRCHKSEPRWPHRPHFAFRPAPAWFESWRRTTGRFYTLPWELTSWPSA